MNSNLPLSNYTNFSTTPNYNTLSTYALALTLNKDYQPYSNYGSTMNRHLADIMDIKDSHLSPLAGDQGVTSPSPSPKLTSVINEKIPHDLEHYLGDLSLNDNRILPLGYSQGDLNQNSLNSMDWKQKSAYDDILSPYKSNQDYLDGSNIRFGKDSEDLSTQESSSDHNNSFEHGYGVDSSYSLKSAPVSLGLRNLGNTCYMNSVLQCLFNSEDLCSYLEKNMQFIEKSNANLTSQFIEMIKNAFTKKDSRDVLKSLYNFKRAIGRVAPIFQGNSQNDSHEFFTLLLEKMHEELNVAPKKKAPYEEFNSSIEGKDFQEIAEEWKRYSRDRDDSLITSVFGGTLLTEVSCEACGHVSYKFEDSLDLSLNLQNLRGVPEDEDIMSLYSCLKDFVTPEPLEGYACDKCKERSTSFKRTTIWKQPDILVVQLKRFVYDMYGDREAVKDSVSFPVDNLSLHRYIHEESNENTGKYHLYGLVNHYGSLNSGHYMAIVYNEEQECWYQYNDDYVTRISEEEMFEYATGSSEPYVLFYKRV